MSYPNQKILTVVKPKGPTVPPFLQISEEDWRAACQILTYSAFKLYLVLAQNADGFDYELSPRRLESEGLMSHQSVIRAREELEKAGYIEGSRFYIQSRAVREQRAEMRTKIDAIKAAPVD